MNEPNKSSCKISPSRGKCEINQITSWALFFKNRKKLINFQTSNNLSRLGKKIRAKSCYVRCTRKKHLIYSEHLFQLESVSSSQNTPSFFTCIYLDECTQKKLPGFFLNTKHSHSIIATPHKAISFECINLLCLSPSCIRMLHNGHNLA